MRKIAVMTSGGDAPGMNAAIRAVARVGVARGLEVIGVERGYQGLVRGESVELSRRGVGGIVQHGGTILGTARSEEFRTPEGLAKSIDNLRKWAVEGLVVIGGNGSLRGALELHRAGVRVVGVPASIDNDLPGSQMAIGADTALNTALEAIDRIKDTASAHQRAFIVEVMGRDCGYLALMAGFASGAEVVLIPEVETTVESVIQGLREAYERGKPHFIVVAAEGASLKAETLRNHISALREKGFEARLTVLGHVQRGGSPSAFDRILATRFGVAAVECLLNGMTGQMVALVGSAVVPLDLETALSGPCGLNMDLYQLSRVLAK
ncbi:MAG: 6-phosphofructokinase [Chloroflexi bacterium]|nr:6-phosphofructokinase [Chloroflexota bacterium]